MKTSLPHIYASLAKKKEENDLGISNYIFITF